MIGSAAARGRETVHRATVIAVVRGCIIGPGAGLATAYAIGQAVLTITGSPHLLAAAR